MKAFAYPFVAAAALAGGVTPAQAEDFAVGRVAFQQRCQMCHAVTADGRSAIGPNLRSVVNRPVASANYAYSAALKGYKRRWTKEELDRFLAAPTKVVPGTPMSVAIPDAAQRASVIAYLSTLGR